MILGIYGQKGSGKSFVSNAIKNGLESTVLNKGDVYTTGMAEGLKKICVDILCLPPESIYGNDHQKNQLSEYSWETVPSIFRGDRNGKMTYREVMQLLGSEIMRDMFRKTIWVDGTIQRIRQRGAILSIIDDVRFENEIDAIKLNGGEVWAIQGVRRADDRFKNDKHQSEKELNIELFDHIITNGLEDDAASIFRQAKESRMFKLAFNS